MQANIVDLNEAFKNCLLSEDEAGMERCFQCSLNFAIMLEWMYEKKNYFGLEYVLQHMPDSEHNDKNKLKLKIYAEALEAGNKEIARKIEYHTLLDSYSLSYTFGKFGYNHEKIPAGLCDYGEYMFGLIKGNHLALFEKLHRKLDNFGDFDMAHFMGLYGRKNFMAYFGYEPSIVEWYLKGLFHTRNFEEELTNELLKKVEAPRVLHEILMDFLSEKCIDLDHCRRVIQKGARLNEEELTNLKEKRPNIFNELFEADV